MSFSLILLAAGNSNRFKSILPKPYHKIGNKSLIEISLHKILKFKQIKKIFVVINEKHKKYTKKLNLKKTQLIKGGKTRQDSTFLALKKLIKIKNIKNVLIHDAARPNFSTKLLSKIILKSKMNSTVIPRLNISDAIKKNKKNRFINLKRKEYFTTQTPQLFNLKEIFNLHKKNKKKYLDDDLSLIENYKKISFVNGEKNNFKITNLEDFKNLRKYFKMKLNLGIGFDVHRLVPNKKLLLAGLKIPSKFGTQGHSDGDPVLHAITDALLGACKMGDIGEKFSDKKKEFKNISSSILLKKIVDEAHQKNFLIKDLDINIITEKPKIKKYKNRMLKNISKLCKIPLDKINIKAKTAEKLGVIGKEKAIACEVIMSVISYD